MGAFLRSGTTRRGEAGGPPPAGLRLLGRRPAAVLGARRPAQTLAVFALAAVGLMAALGLSIDVGNLYLQRRIAQNAADAAARAGARALVVNASVVAAVDSYLAANSWGGVPTTRASGAFVDSNGQELLPLGPLAPLGAVGVRVTARRTVPTYFLGIVGVATTAADATATVVTSGITSLSGEPMWPIAVKEQLFVEGASYPIWDSVMEAAGSRGWLDLNGGGGSASELRDWIVSGGFVPTPSDPIRYYSDCGGSLCGSTWNTSTALTPPMWIETSTGNKTSACHEAGNHLGETVIVLLYNTTGGGSGSNLKYRVTGFAAFTVTAVTCTGSLKQIVGTYERIVLSGQTGGGSTSSSLMTLGVLN